MNVTVDASTSTGPPRTSISRTSSARSPDRLTSTDPLTSSRFGGKPGRRRTVPMGSGSSGVTVSPDGRGGDEVPLRAGAQHRALHFDSKPLWSGCNLSAKNHSCLVQPRAYCPATCVPPSPCAPRGCPTAERGCPGDVPRHGGFAVGGTGSSHRDRGEHSRVPGADLRRPWNREEMRERGESTPAEPAYDPADDPDADPAQLEHLAERPSKAEGEDE